MVIVEGTGSIFDSGAMALVNPVNCVGICGKGLALEFKTRFPVNFVVYRSMCRDGLMKSGHVLVTYGCVAGPPYIINFPTKRHWKDSSKIEDIESGLKSMVSNIKTLQIHSVAIPAIGCGLGGLDWKDVRPKIEEAMASVPSVHVILFPPR